MTGGPLVQMNERSRTPDPSIGLIGAIEAREQERRNMKEGLAGHMVQEAIAQRQHAERNYGMQQYSPPVDNRHSGQWINPPTSTHWAVTHSQQQQQQQPWSNQSAWQQQQQAQAQQAQQAHLQQQNQMYDARYSGYHAPLGGYGPR